MDTKRAEIMATARTQDTDSRCHNVGGASASG